jgi:serine/threonine-protein kinase RsbW
MRWPVDMKFSLDLPRETISIPLVRRVVGDTLRGLGVSEDCVTDLLVATSEACTNAVQHAEATSRYEVNVSVADGRCVLTIADHGRGFDGESGDSVHPDAESGRGIKIMRALVDDVSFHSRPDTGTIVSLQKRLSWQDDHLLRLFEPELLKTAG